MKATNHIRVGTSGWHYQHWKGPFYPETIKSGELLRFYAARFPTSEINNSFYKLPTSDTLQQWREAVNSDFCFSVKASRYITHMKKLKDPDQTLAKFFKVVETLDGKLGPILFQLPPNWTCNLDRLNAFLEALPSEGYQYAFEFRDSSWFNEDVYKILELAGAAFCIYDMGGKTSPKEITADFVYVRLHGPDEKYEGKYPVQTLAGWAGAFSAWSRQGKQVYCYFDNDENGYAAQDALRLWNMVRPNR